MESTFFLYIFFFMSPAANLFHLIRIVVLVRVFFTMIRYEGEYLCCKQLNIVVVFVTVSGIEQKLLEKVGDGRQRTHKYVNSL